MGYYYPIRYLYKKESMAVNNTELEILNKIVEIEGKCLQISICPSCPFRGKTCLYHNEHTLYIIPSSEERVDMALTELMKCMVNGDL